MRFIGTSAGEGIPDPFCTCPICENARRVGGKELRSRSSFLLDEETIIDLGADYFSQARDHGLRLDSLRRVILTHTHDDHFNYTFFWERSVKRAGTEEPLTVILSEEGKRFFDELYALSAALGSEKLLTPPNALLKTVTPGVPFEAGNYRVTPLRGRHSTAFEKNSTNYLIERNGESLYYGGHIGYAVDAGYRGHHYAARACRLLFGLARRHGMGYLIITCDPENTASARTALAAGFEWVERAVLPETNEMRLTKGKEEAEIYAVSLDGIR